MVSIKCIVNITKYTEYVSEVIQDEENGTIEYIINSQLRY